MTWNRLIAGAPLRAELEGGNETRAQLGHSNSDAREEADRQYESGRFIAAPVGTFAGRATGGCLEGDRVRPEPHVRDAVGPQALPIRVFRDLGAANAARNRARRRLVLAIVPAAFVKGANSWERRAEARFFGFDGDVRRARPRPAGDELSEMWACPRNPSCEPGV